MTDLSYDYEFRWPDWLPQPSQSDSDHEEAMQPTRETIGSTDLGFTYPFADTSARNAEELSRLWHACVAAEHTKRAEALAAYLAAAGYQLEFVELGSGAPPVATATCALSACQCPLVRTIPHLRFDIVVLNGDDERIWSFDYCEHNHNFLSVRQIRGLYDRGSLPATRIPTHFTRTSIREALRPVVRRYESVSYRLVPEEPDPVRVWSSRRMDIPDAVYENRQERIW